MRRLPTFWYGLPVWGTAVMLALPVEAGAATCDSVLNHTATSIRGEPVNLCQYAGKVVLVVNTASQCGYTPQYKGLEALFQKYKSQGLVVLGFPANDFGRQEPGSNADIAEFCERRFNVKFPMFEKVTVKGTETHPLFAALAAKGGGAPQWNFHKYLISRDGRTVVGFASDVEPDSPAVAVAVETALRQK